MAKKTSTAQLKIPKHIEQNIKERGFHLYEWISPDEVKLSIQRDFLKVLKRIWLPLAIVSSAAGVISGVNFVVFFTSIILWVLCMFVYLVFLSFKRSMLLSKSAFVILTASSICIGGKIQKLDDTWSYSAAIAKVSKTFEEDLFWSSRLSHSKHSLLQDVMKQLFGGYMQIFRIAENRIGSSRNSLQLTLALIALYTIYIVFMACVYFFGVLGLWMFGKALVWINTKYMIKKWETAILIQHLFEELSEKNAQLVSAKKQLKHKLIQAQENAWQDGLLLKIHSDIEQIDQIAGAAIVTSVKLKATIERSRYKDMFCFEVYNGWIKKQIASPLREIDKLLQKNLDWLQNSKADVQRQIDATKKTDLLAALTLSSKRIQKAIWEIQQARKLFEKMLQKLW